MDRITEGTASSEMSNLARYKNGHLFDLYNIGSDRSPLMEQLGAKLGGLTAKDFSNFDKFSQRVQHLSDVATSRNCRLYVDAEQTFI